MIPLGAMDSITSALVVANIIRTLAVLHLTLQTPTQQAAIPVADSELRGLSEVLLQSKTLWERWGYELCLPNSRFPVFDEDVLDIQRLIDQARVLCEAIRFQTLLQQHYSQGLRIGHISERVFERGQVRRIQTVVFEQLRVLGDLKSVLERYVSL